MPAGIGLSRDAMDRAFPFHFVLDPRLRLMQIGPVMARIVPELKIGETIEGALRPLRPAAALDAEVLAANEQYPFLIEHPASGMRFRGQFMSVQGGSWIFLGSPWFDAAEDIEQAGLSLRDFAVHDPIADLLMIGHTQRLGMDDLIKLSERLERKSSELARTEAVYRRAIAAGRAVPYREDLTSGSFDFIGDEIEALTGFKAAEMTPALLRSLILESAELAPSDQTQIQPGPDEGLQRRVDHRIRTRSGAERWVNESSVLIQDEQGRPVSAIGILVDITRRKQVESRLRASEERANRLADVVARTASVVAITDSERRIEWVNPAFTRITGYEPDDVLGKQAREVFYDPSVHPEFDQSMLSRFSAGEDVSGEIEVRHKDGRQIWLSLEAQLVSGRAGQAGWMFVANDITERRETEQRLRASEETAKRLALVAARTDNAVILTDTKRRIEWVNEGFTRLTGYSLEEVRGTVPGHLLQGPDTDPATVDYMRGELARGKGFRCEIQNQSKDGRVYWLTIEVQPIHDEQGRHTGYMAIESDITARKQYEARLEQLSSELDTILNLSPDGFVAFDLAHRLSYCNPAFEQMVGRFRTELRGSSCQDVDTLLAGLCGRGQPPPAPILSIKPGTTDQLDLQNPARLVISRTVRDIHNVRGDVRGRVVFLRDITRLKELDRMKSEFLSAAAHELRTPMTSIQGFAELMMSDDLDAATRRDLAETVHRQSSILVGMVNELLDLQRIDAGKGRDFEMVPYPLGKLLHETVSQLRIKGDDRKVVLHPLPGEEVWVQVDTGKMMLALTNVLSNAYKYSPAGGEISVETTRRIADGRPQVGIAVRDRGIGMSPEQVARVFERFFRADPSGAIPGTGLGMSLVKEVVEFHGGEVAVQSSPGQGTTVSIWLPEVA